MALSTGNTVAYKATGGAEYNTVPPNVGTSGAGGNGGAAVKVGSGASGLVDNVVSAEDQSGLHGSQVVEGASTGCQKALSAGTFRGDNAEVIAKRVTDTLAASVSNTQLLSGAAVPGNRRSVHKYPATFATRLLTTAIRAGQWNIFTGVFTVAPTVTSADAFKNIDGGGVLDKAANPTRTEPGRLVFKTGKPAPNEQVYSTKTGG